MVYHIDLLGHNGAGNVSVCQISDTNYVPLLYVNNDGSNTGALELINNVDGANTVTWKVQENVGWLTGTATYFID